MNLIKCWFGKKQQSCTLGREWFATRTLVLQIVIWTFWILGKPPTRWLYLVTSNNSGFYGIWRNFVLKVLKGETYFTQRWSVSEFCPERMFRVALDVNYTFLFSQNQKSAHSSRLEKHAKSNETVILSKQIVQPQICSTARSRLGHLQLLRKISTPIQGLLSNRNCQTSGWLEILGLQTPTANIQHNCVRLRALNRTGRHRLLTVETKKKKKKSARGSLPERFV